MMSNRVAKRVQDRFPILHATLAKCLAKGWTGIFVTPDAALDFELVRTSTTRLGILIDEVRSFRVNERERIDRSLLHGSEVDLYFRDLEAAVQFLNLVEAKANAILRQRTY